MDCGTLAPKAQKRQPPMAGSWRNITHRHDCGWWNGTIVIALGKQIKAVRKAMGMTQDQLALKSHVSVKYIANIENGKQNPSFDILSAILHVLPLSLDSIINPNLSELESECREWDAIYLACPPEMRKTLLEATRSLAIHLTEFSEQNKNT